MLIDRLPYSFTEDPSVPAFDSPEFFTVMDATCGLCAKGARWIARNDTQAKFRIVPMQSELGAALIRHYGMDPGDPLSWLYVRQGEAFASLDAVIRVGQELGGRWHLLRVLRIFPNAVQNVLYGWVARNRYRLMGRVDLCSMPDPDIQVRLLQ